MKVVAGSFGNDAIGLPALVSGGVAVWPDEWVLERADRIISITILVSHGGLRVVEVTSPNGSGRGAVA